MNEPVSNRKKGKKKSAGVNIMQNKKDVVPGKSVAKPAVTLSKSTSTSSEPSTCPENRDSSERRAVSFVTRFQDSITLMRTFVGNPWCLSALNKDIWATFEIELKWCIDQLQKQLSSSKLTTKQADETTKLIKILVNPKAPLIKKRQTMRTTFGDYRERMKSEELKFKKDCKKKPLAVMEPSRHKGTFIKRCTTLSEQNADLSDKLIEPPIALCQPENSFTFNFCIAN